MEHVYLFTDLISYCDQFKDRISKLKTLITTDKKDKKERVCKQRMLLLVKLLELVQSNLEHSWKKIAETKPDSSKCGKIYRALERVSQCEGLIKDLQATLPANNLIRKYVPVIVERKPEIDELSKSITNTIQNLSSVIFDETGVLINLVETAQVNREVELATQQDEKKICKQFEKEYDREFNAQSGLGKKTISNDTQTEGTTQPDKTIKYRQTHSLRNCLSPKENNRRDRLDKTLLVDFVKVLPGPALVQGCTGTIYSGVFRKQKVAIKSFEGVGASIDEKTGEDEFFNEIKKMAAVRSDYVVPVYAIVWEEDYKYLVMKYMEKGSLYSCLGREEFSLGDKCQLALGIAIGLLNLHDRMMSHGNLTSHNVLIDEHNAPKLTDFSCSKTRAVSLTSQQHKPVVSSEWTAPENLPKNCVRGVEPLLNTNDIPQSSDTRNMASDIYSLGLIIWEIFTGKHPFSQLAATRDRTGDLQQYTKDVSKSIENGISKSHSLEGFPAKIRELIDKCWLKDCQQRPSIGDVIDDLEAYIKRIRNEDVLRADENLLTETLHKAEMMSEAENQYLAGRSHVYSNRLDQAINCFKLADANGYGEAKIALVQLYLYVGGSENLKMAKIYYDQIKENALLERNCCRDVRWLDAALTLSEYELKLEQAEKQLAEITRKMIKSLDEMQTQKNLNDHIPAYKNRINGAKWSMNQSYGMEGPLNLQVKIVTPSIQPPEMHGRGRGVTQYQGSMFARSLPRGAGYPIHPQTHPQNSNGNYSPYTQKRGGGS